MEYDTRVELAAFRMACAFTDDGNLPKRLRKSTQTTSTTATVNSESKAEVNLATNVRSWQLSFETLLSKRDPLFAWRVIELNPQVLETDDRITVNADFCDLIDYLDERRKDDASADELGVLGMLSLAFQRELEKRIEAQKQ